MEKRLYDYHAQTTLDRRYLAGLFGAFQLSGRVPRSVSEIVRWAVEETVEAYVEQQVIRLPDTTNEATSIIERYTRGTAPSETKRYRKALLRNLTNDEDFMTTQAEMLEAIEKIKREGVKTLEQLKAEEEAELNRVLGFKPVEKIADLYVDGVADRPVSPKDTSATRPKTEAERDFEAREAEKLERLRLAAKAPRAPKTADGSV